MPYKSFQRVHYEAIKTRNQFCILPFIAYWVIGLSVGLVLGLTDWFIEPIGPYGFWIGFISGLTCAAFMLAWRLKIVQHRLEMQPVGAKIAKRISFIK